MAFVNSNSLTSSAAKVQQSVADPNVKPPKFVRSKDRCHILTRTPVYDRKGNTLCYKFRYTAGEGSFRPDELQKKHVKHVLIGFYVRRHVDQFAFENAFAMTELPLSIELTKFSKPLPANRFILHLQDKQEATASYQHQVNMLRRDTMTIAADVYTIVYTNWFRELRSMSYAVIDMTLDVEEQFILAKNIVKKAPWIKILCDRCDTLNMAQIAFEAGADYVCCPTFPKDVYRNSFNAYKYKSSKLCYERICTCIGDLLEGRPTYLPFLELIENRQAIKSQIPLMLDFINDGAEAEYYYQSIESSLYDIDVDTLNKLISIISMLLLDDFFRSDTERAKPLKFEPIRQALVRAKFYDELMNYKSTEADPTYAFILGLSSSMRNMYTYLTPAIEAGLDTIDMNRDQVFKDYPVYAQVEKIVESMESLDLHYVDGIIAANIFTRHDILYSYENALIWVSKLTDLISQKRY
ncbi:MAG: hypothetical protein ACI4NE_08230 [Succinivibrio sp.]